MGKSRKKSIPAISRQMKKAIIAFAVSGLVVIGAFLWKASLIAAELNILYLNIQVLDHQKYHLEEGRKSDNDYRFLYFHSSKKIAYCRETFQGKMVSDWLENRNERLKKYRLESEAYLKKVGNVEVDPAQSTSPKIDIIIDR